MKIIYGFLISLFLLSYAFCAEQFIIKATGENGIYTISRTKTVKDINDKDVTIIESTEDVTLQGLEDKLAEYQAKVDEIQAQIDAINAL